MRNLERLITQARNMLVYGLTQDEVNRELVARGTDPELVYWAIRAAQFELKQQEEIRHAQIQG